MFYVDGGDIYIHRGDTASFDLVFGDAENVREGQVSAMSIYGINWIPEDGTPIRFSVKCDTGRIRPVIQKDYVVWNGFVTIDLNSKDTSCLPFGQYKWDARVSFDNADGVNWNTPFNAFNFTVCEVVGNV